MNYVMAKIDAHYLFDEFLLMENIYSAGLLIPYLCPFPLSLSRSPVSLFIRSHLYNSIEWNLFSVHSIHFASISISISAITFDSIRVPFDDPAHTISSRM